MPLQRWPAVAEAAAATEVAAEDFTEAAATEGAADFTEGAAGFTAADFMAVVEVSTAPFHTAEADAASRQQRAHSAMAV